MFIRSFRCLLLAGILIALFFAAGIINGCTTSSDKPVPSSAGAIQSDSENTSPAKPPDMDVSPYSPKISLPLEMAPGAYYTALVVPSNDSQAAGRLVLRLYSWQEPQKVWKEVYSEPISNMVYPQIKISRIIPDRDSLVLYSREGSGSFVYLRVLSFFENTYKAIISPAQPQGHSNVIVGGDKIVVETSMGNQIIYTWNGTDVVVSKGQKEVKPTTTSDVQFTYNTLSDGRIDLPSEKVTIKVGDTIHLVQGQALARMAGVRLLWSGANMEKILQYQQESVAPHQVYKGIGPGSAVVTIIANGGYDWQHARKVTVEVVP